MSQNLSSAAVLIGALRVNVLKCWTLFMPPPTSGHTLQKQGPTLEISLPPKKVGCRCSPWAGEPICAILWSFLAFLEARSRFLSHFPGLYNLKLFHLNVSHNAIHQNLHILVWFLCDRSFKIEKSYSTSSITDPNLKGSLTLAIWLYAYGFQ